MDEGHNVVRPRNTGAGSPDRQLAGQRFSAYIHVAMDEAKPPLTLAELVRQSGVKERTWHDWFEGKHAPSMNLLRHASKPLNRPAEAMRAVWDGERPQKPRKPTESGDPLVSALGRHTDAIERLVALLAPLVGNAETGLAARLDTLEPVVARLVERAGPASPKPRVPRRTKG
jgi:transcriptional regulator with XRE-family HTH domain